MKLRSLLTTLTLLALLWSPAVAEWTPRAGIIEIEVGISGHYKTGVWTPVRVSLSGVESLRSATVSVIAPDSDGVPCRTTTHLSPPTATADSKPAKEAQSVLLYARIGRTTGKLTVELHSDEQLVIAATFDASAPNGVSTFRPALQAGHPLIVAVASGPIGLTEAIRKQSTPQEKAAVVAEVREFARLPDKAMGYEGVDTVVLSTRDLKPYQNPEEFLPQVQALKQWVAQGGRLLLCVGRNGEALIGGPDAPLTPFLPGEFAGMVPLRQSATFERYAAINTPMPPLGTAEEPWLLVPKIEQVQGLVEAQEADLPLVIRSASGFGQIVFFAGDPDDPAIAAWEGRSAVINRLLGVGDDRIEDAQKSKTLVNVGYLNLAGQLRSALDQFPTVRLVPFFAVIALAVLYLLAIGPGDYFFVRRVLRKMGATWVTFPLTVIVFSVGTYFLGTWLKGNEVLVNQAVLIDIDTESGRLRGTTWANVFSPEVARYNFEFTIPQLADGAPNDSMKTSWFGLTGSALGGMAPTTITPTVWSEPYESGEYFSSINGVPIQVYSTKSLTGRWTENTQLFPQAELVDRSEFPSGTITNTMETPLSNCVLAYGRWIYELGDLAPGARVRVDAASTRRELSALLTESKFVFREDEVDTAHEQAIPYSHTSTDVAGIVRAMMLFEAADGHRYTRLTNSYQQFVDMSRLLASGRAVMIAETDTSASDAPPYGALLSIQRSSSKSGSGPTDSVLAKTRSTTVYRFVFPVAEPSEER